MDGRDTAVSRRVLSLLHADYAANLHERDRLKRHLASKEFEYQLGGKANLQFGSEGLKAVLELPCTPELVVLGC
jgi:hypothetical protein